MNASVRDRTDALGQSRPPPSCVVAMIPSLLWLLADVQYRLRTVIAREGKDAAYGREIALYRQRKFQL